jgi:MFS family permease
LKLIYIAAIAFPITPLFWLFLKDPIFLILLPGFTAGLGNAALSIGTTNFTYDAVSPQKRGICVAYMSVLSGIGIFFGSILGGLMIQYLSISFMNTTLFVFALAAVLRSAVLIFFLPQIKEEYGKNPKLRGLSWDVSHPFKTVHSDIIWFKKLTRDK